MFVSIRIYTLITTSVRIGEMNTQRIIVNGMLEHNNRVLIARRSMSKKIAPGKYHLPGGHVEFGEAPDEAIVREFAEEFGITVQAEQILRTFMYTISDVHTVGISFILSFDGNIEAITVDGIENDEISWVSENELANYFDPSDHNYVTLKRYFSSKV